MSRILGAAAVFASLSTGASAATLVVEAGPGPTVTVQQFNPALGTLTNISGEVTGTSTFNITTNVASQANVAYEVRNYYGIYFGSIYFDATGIGVGTGNITGNQLTVTTFSSDTQDWATETAFNVFTGTGTVLGSPTINSPFQLILPSGIFPTNVAFGPRTAQIRITYTYTPFGGEVPEPATWAMMIVGFGLVGGVTRRRLMTAM